MALAVTLLTLSGCVTVNPHSAVRLSRQAMQTTQLLSRTLAEARAGLHGYVDSQTLSAPLQNEAPLSNDTLCQLQLVQQSLRQREGMLLRLSRAYEHFALLAQEGADRWSGEVFDNLLVDLDPMEFIIDTPLSENCPLPADTAVPLLSTFTPAPAPPRLVRPSVQLQRASERLRGLLQRVTEVLIGERPIFVSLLKQQLRARANLAKALYLRYGVIAPSALLAPTLSGLGLSYSEVELRLLRGLKDADQQALRAAMTQLLNRRVEQQAALLTAQFDQQVAVLQALARQHERLEAGQPMDLRVLAQWVVPVPAPPVSPASSVAPLP